MGGLALVGGPMGQRFFEPRWDREEGLEPDEKVDGD